MAIEGMIDVDDLWWFYEKYRIMAPAGVWALVLMWDGRLSDGMVDRMGCSGWWQWFDHGICDARYRQDRD